MLLSLFLIALNKFLRENNFFTEINKEPDLLQLLDLVSLGTMCDVVPLGGLNRVFVNQGLKILNKKIEYLQLDNVVLVQGNFSETMKNSQGWRQT